MGTLIKKIKSDSSYLWLKTMESEIYISGFPKKACQGCHISELAQWNDARCTSFWSILDPWLNSIDRIHWSRNDPKKQLCPSALYWLYLLSCFYTHCHWSLFEPSAHMAYIITMDNGATNEDKTVTGRLRSPSCRDSGGWVDGVRDIGEVVRWVSWWVPNQGGYNVKTKFGVSSSLPTSPY